jgi:hypothetical protein
MKFLTVRIALYTKRLDFHLMQKRSDFHLMQKLAIIFLDTKYDNSSRYGMYGTWSKKILKVCEQNSDFHL